MIVDSAYDDACAAVADLVDVVVRLDVDTADYFDAVVRGDACAASLAAQLAQDVDDAAEAEAYVVAAFARAHAVGCDVADDAGAVAGSAALRASASALLADVDARFADRPVA